MNEWNQETIYSLCNTMLCHALKAIYMLKRDLLVVICSIRITTRSMICFLKKSCIVHSIFFFFSFSRALTLRSARIAISCWCLGKQSKLRHVNWNQSCSVDLCKCKCAAVSDNSKLRHVWNKHQVQGLSIVRNICSMEKSKNYNYIHSVHCSEGNFVHGGAENSVVWIGHHLIVFFCK